MGAALGYALSQKAAVTLSVFTAMGLGMAAPYTALVSWPALGRWVPRPGEWMETLKQAMGFLLLGTTVWLLWVLGRQSGPDVLILVLAMFWSIGMGAWILGKWALPSRSGAARRLALSLGLLLILGGGTGAVVFSRRTMAEPAGLAWQTYSPERLAESLQAGKPVFMDFTAAWCLTCQVNERTALRDKQVVERFQALGVVPLKADWTTYDPAITRALQEHGRSGVPLYVLYGGAGGRPARILPTLLTPQVVLNALEEEISSHLKGGK
jgi:thiol:disulfide interchange protein DsbD